VRDGGSDRRGWVQIGGTYVPNWISAICAVLLLSGVGAGVNAAVSSSGSSKHPPVPPPKQTPTTPIYLGTAGPTETKPGSNTGLASGVASISGASFPKSVRQLYNANCCSDSQSATYEIPEGYTHFQASLGLETGNGYDESGSPALTFEVDLGGASNRAYAKQMRYGEPPRRISIDVSGQSSIVLQTQTDGSNCFTCSADAVWGTAKLIP
jgi:hypothetical protein